VALGSAGSAQTNCGRRWAQGPLQRATAMLRPLSLPSPRFAICVDEEEDSWLVAAGASSHESDGAFQIGKRRDMREMKPLGVAGYHSIIGAMAWSSQPGADQDLCGCQIRHSACRDPYVTHPAGPLRFRRPLSGRDAPRHCRARGGRG
jgi:hypothetical protein